MRFEISRLNAVDVHLLAVRQPIVTSFRQCSYLRPGMDFDLVGIVESEIEKFLVAEVVDFFVDCLAEIGIYFVHAIHRAGFRVVVILAFLDLKCLRS